MVFNWSDINHELSLWRSEGRTLKIWWRDDDAVSHTAALDQLIDISCENNITAHLAVIPKFADQSLATTCNDLPTLVPLVHGWAHENHAPQDQKRAEFGHDREGLFADANNGIRAMEDLFGSEFLPCFVPPWNRVFPDLLPQLPQLGFSCISTFTTRRQRLAARDLVQVNTHIDPINWRESGGLIAPEVLENLILSQLRDRRMGLCDAGEPLGLLTHHLMHDPAIWEFTNAFLQALLDGGASPVNLFDLKDDLP